MHHRSVALVTVLLIASRAPAAAQEPLALVDVHVLTMETEDVLRDHTVLVKDGRIEALGPSAELAVPTDYRVVQGEGRTLLPGLADMHVHIWNESELLLNLAAGVTSVRNLWGAPIHLEWQAQIRAGSFFGPNIYSTGPIIDGIPTSWDGSVGIDDPDLAFAEVERQKAAGYPSIKVYGVLKEDVYVALVEAARELDLRVTGHVPYQVGLLPALELQQDCIEHMEGYFAGFTNNRPVLDTVELVALTLEAGTTNCPTLTVIRNIAMLGDPAELQARPEMRFVDPATRASWDPTGDFRFRNMGASAYDGLRERVGAMQALVLALHEAGARILCGTDTPNPYVIPGFAVHDELELLVAAGLSPHAALRAATVDAAAYLGEASEFGRIAPGMRADLLLLEENPLEDIAATRDRAGVVVRGEWFAQAELETRMEELAASYERGVDLTALVLPDEGEEWFEGRYELRTNDVVAGIHRVAVRRLDEDRTVILTSAASIDGATEELRLELDGAFRPLRFAFRQELAGTEQRITGERDGDGLRLAGEPDMGSLPGELELGEGSLLSLPSPAALQMLALRAAGLAPGDELRLLEHELLVYPNPKLERHETVVRRIRGGSDLVRTYEVQSRGEDRRIEFVVDAQGRLLEVRQNRQIGRVHFLLAEDE